MQITMICLPFKSLVYIPTNKTFAEYFIIVNKKYRKLFGRKKQKQYLCNVKRRSLRICAPSSEIEMLPTKYQSL